MELKNYVAKNFEYLLGIKGFSEILLRNHFLLYQGYVKNVNDLLTELNSLLVSGKTDVIAFSEGKRRFGWEFNGMVLHELYFENLAKESLGIDRESDFFQKIVADFGSFENWEKDFKATGIMRGIGWVVLCYDPTLDRLMNIWINEHDTGHLAKTTPLLVMDVFEHAYLTDYGIKKADYVETCLHSINWQLVSERFDKICVE